MQHLRERRHNCQVLHGSEQTRCDTQKLRILCVILNSRHSRTFYNPEINDILDERTIQLVHAISVEAHDARVRESLKHFAKLLMLSARAQLNATVARRRVDFREKFGLEYKQLWKENLNPKNLIIYS